MGINLENTDAKFRAIVAAGERSAQAARVRRVLDLVDGGIRAPAAKPIAAPALDGHSKRKRASAPRSGRRYRVEFTVFTCYPPDWDGVNCKAVQDQLVRQGWLPDGDGWRELEGTARAVKVAHKNEQRTEVKLTRLA